MDWTCDACGRKITPGSFYVKIVDVSDTTFPAFRTHTDENCDSVIAADILAIGGIVNATIIERQVWEDQDALEIALPEFAS